MPARFARVALVVVLACLAAAVLRLAWLGDDAYITLRSVENLLQGHGPRWNVADRVQVYTHPLWFWLLAAARALSGEAYWTTLVLGCLLTAGVVWRLARLAGGPGAAAVAVLLLLGSRAFTDYATSGLENPLANLLAVLLAAALLTQPGRGAGRFAALSGGLALLATTRFDLALLLGPAWLAAAWAAPWSWRLRGVLAMAPLWGWLAFAAFYYGSPFPITAYAKALAHGVPAGELAVQGLHYLVACARHDPLTSAVLAAGVVTGLSRGGSARALTLGVLLYLAYVVKIGGDFMVGRFLTAPFVVALAVLLQAWRDMPRVRLAAACAAPMLTLLGGVPAFATAPGAETSPTEEWHGVVDERRSYHGSLGLFGPQRSIPVPGVASAALRPFGNTPLVVAWGQAGRYGFEAGDLVHLCDPWLLDPLLMRLPIADPGRWRIGHFERRIPEGYLESLAFGANLVVDPALRRVHERLHLITRAPLTDPARLAALWQWWTGAADDDLRSYVAGTYRQPPRLAVAAAALDPPVAAGTLWCREPRVRVIYAGGLAVRLAAPVTGGRLRALVAGVVPYTFTLRRGGATVATLTVTPTTRWELGLQPVELAVPASAGAFDEVWVDGVTGFDSIACLGGLQWLP